MAAISRIVPLLISTAYCVPLARFEAGLMVNTAPVMETSPGRVTETSGPPDWFRSVMVPAPVSAMGSEKVAVGLLPTDTFVAPSAGVTEVRVLRVGGVASAAGLVGTPKTSISRKTVPPAVAPEESRMLKRIASMPVARMPVESVTLTLVAPPWTEPAVPLAGWKLTVASRVKAALPTVLTRISYLWF